MPAAAMWTCPECGRTFANRNQSHSCAPPGDLDQHFAHLGVIGWIREVVLDTADPHRLAAFWAALLGGAPVQWYPGWVTLEPPPHGQRLSFQGTGATPQAGPGVHFDILVSDLDRAQQRVVALGGSFVAEHVSPRPGPGGQPVSWRVCRDPDGHVFCLVTRLSELSACRTRALAPGHRRAARRPQWSRRWPAVA